MKAARQIGTLVMILILFLALGAATLAQEHHDGNLAERQKAPTVLGGTGLFNTFSTRTLCKGEFNFALFWNNFDRDPGDIDVNQVPFNFTIGLTNRWELWVNWVTWQNTTSRQPFLLSGYQYNAVRAFGDPFTLLGPPVGGKEGPAAFFPGTGSLVGGILPALGRFGQPIDFPQSAFLPGGAGTPAVRGLGPLFSTVYPSYNPEFPFFGEVDFQGFDSLGRPVFGPRESSNGTGDVTIGTKVSLIDANKHWFSMALGGYLKIPISSSDDARARGRTSGEYEFGPFLAFGQESGAKRFRLYENIGYIHPTDPRDHDVKYLDLPDKLQFNVGTGIGLGSHVELVGEIMHTMFVGSSTPRLIENDPWEMNIGLRFFFKDGRISFGGGYRRFLNNEDDRTIPVFRAQTIFVQPPFFIINPTFDTVNTTFGSEGQNGFVAYFNIGSRRSCPPPPAPTCVLTPSGTTVNRGERLTLSTNPTTPGYPNEKVTYEYRWQVADASGRPVTVSGTGASVDVATTGIPCGRYTATATVTATVPAVDCPSNCVTTGQTTCTASFEITEPPCPTVTCDISANPTSVTEGDRITLHANSTGADGATFTWSVSGGGTLSATTGADVTLDTTGLGIGPGDSRTVTVTVNVGTTRTRCDQPCPGGSCTTTVTVRGPERHEVPPIISPCGPIFFPFNSARINNEHKACLDEIALRLQQDPRASLVIDGHRDSSERVGISLTRANNARDYLVNEKGVDAARITVRNFGDTCPHESGDPNLNRRVEFWIVPEGNTASAIDTQKKCGAGASPRVITDETPAASDDRKRPARRTPRRRGRTRRPGEPIDMITMAQPEAPTSSTH